MTWNILHDVMGENENEHPWRSRRQAARALVTRAAPDVLCLQEAFPHQADDLLSDMPHHWWVGRDRHGGNEREGCPVAFDTRRLAELSWGQFWLGVTPDVPRTFTWGNDVPRIATWVRFEDRVAGGRFRVVSTHLDHLVPTARTNAAMLIADRLSDATLDEPTVLAGDFNSPAWSRPHRMLVDEEAGFADTRQLAERREPWYGGTFHHFKRHAFVRVDWILTRPAVRTLTHRVLRDRPNGILPSDHFPVVAEFAVPFETPEGILRQEIPAHA